MFDEIKEKKRKIGIVGLGYVGLPLALEFGKKFSVIGFDIKSDRVELMKSGIDPSGELDSRDFVGSDVLFTSSLEDLSQACVFIVAVPTPIDEQKIPDLRPLIRATKMLGGLLKKGDYVVYESTVYPGCTEEVCIPLLEEHSGLKYGDDFKAGFSPERISPGDKKNVLTSIVKVVSGSDAEALAEISKLYGSIISAGVHEASSIKVAEATKILENTQRDVNAALMNEFSVIMNSIGVNTNEVLDAANTKWNFNRYEPGLIGGHCIGVDPYYLIFKSKELGLDPKVMDASRYRNDSMPKYIAGEVAKSLVGSGSNVTKARVLIMGFTFKEGVSDIRNSKVFDLFREVKSFVGEVDVVDPLANRGEVESEYGFTLCDKPSGLYDAVIIAVKHKEYLDLCEDDLKDLTNPNAIVFDIKGILRDRIKDLRYWSL